MSQPASRPAPRIAVLVPCLDEAATIGKVVDDFRRVLPDAAIHVYDNGSTDDTAHIARERGAIVGFEPRPGKGHVIDRMLAEVRADLYVLVDGDDTYPAESAPDLLQPLLEGRADMVVGARLADYAAGSFRPLHVFGNRLVRWLINRVFGARLTDVMSGYRAFGRRVARELPTVSAGFEIETAMTVHLLYHRLHLVEVQVPYRERPAGSQSKLRTFRDGARVLWTIFTLFREVKPLTFFGSAGLALMTAGLLAGAPPVMQYVEYRYVYSVPLAILASALMILSATSVVLGILLHAVNWRLMELHNVLTRAGAAGREDVEGWRPTHPDDAPSFPTPAAPTPADPPPLPEAPAPPEAPETS